MLFVKIKTSEGERTRKELAQAGVLDPTYKIINKDEYLYLAVKKEISGYDVVTLRGRKFKTTKPKTLKDALKGRLSEEELASATKSFDIIGDVAIIEIPDEMKLKEKLFAKALLLVHPNIKVVAKKTGAMEGEFRVRPLKVIFGENRTETIHKEHGCLIKVDPATSYYSVRLSHERERISEMVKDKEHVLVMFAGVGPFALVIAKKKPKTHVVGIELNPAATSCFKENIKLNKLTNCEAVLGDVREVIPKRFVGFADRILMPLPKSAFNFLEVAIMAARNNAIIHFYHFGKEETVFEEAKKLVEDAAKKAGVNIEIIAQRIVRPYAPRIIQISTDFKVKR
jgi:tRNA (guanine37-N1)-methyltransferase